MAVDLPPGTPLEGAAQALQQLVDNTLERVQLGNADGDQRLKRRPWTRKEALGHLIDWGMAHHQWLLQARSESKVAAAAIPTKAPPSIALCRFPLAGRGGSVGIVESAPGASAEEPSGRQNGCALPDWDRGAGSTGQADGHLRRALSRTS